jgi:hypothetical protein
LALAKDPGNASIGLVLGRRTLYRDGCPEHHWGNDFGNVFVCCTNRLGIHAVTNRASGRHFEEESITIQMNLRM